MKQLTAEQVLPGHPDKLCDQISDTILDAHLTDDPHARVAVETMATQHGIIVSGEITSNSQVDHEQIVRDTLRNAGYDTTNGYDPDTISVQLHLNKQSPQIGEGVNTGGAGDQGIIFGYATNEHPTLMPAPWVIANTLAKRLQQFIDHHGGYGPDGKTQATVTYNNEGYPTSLDTVIIAVQHYPTIPVEQVRALVTRQVVLPVAEETGLNLDNLQVLVNTAGPWNLGGPAADTGLTGRKIIADTYGGAARHGGGAFSGKDPTKVDRSAAYAARQAARWVVAEGLADECEIQVAYTIGQADPVSVRVDTFGTGKLVSDTQIAERVRDVFSFHPKDIISRLGLLNPQYAVTASFGHFGNPLHAWER